MWLKVDQTGWLERGFLGPQFEESDGVIWAQPARGPHPPTSCPTNPPALFFCIFIIKTGVSNNDHRIPELCQLVHLLVSHPLICQSKKSSVQLNAMQYNQSKVARKCDNVYRLPVYKDSNLEQSRGRAEEEQSKNTLRNVPTTAGHYFCTSFTRFASFTNFIWSPLLSF